MPLLHVTKHITHPILLIITYVRLYKGIDLFDMNYLYTIGKIYQNLFVCNAYIASYDTLMDHFLFNIAFTLEMKPMCDTSKLVIKS